MVCQRKSQNEGAAQRGYHFRRYFANSLCDRGTPIKLSLRLPFQFSIHMAFRYSSDIFRTSCRNIAPETKTTIARTIAHKGVQTRRFRNCRHDFHCNNRLPLPNEPRLRRKFPHSNIHRNRSGNSDCLALRS